MITGDYKSSDVHYWIYACYSIILVSLCSQVICAEWTDDMKKYSSSIYLRSKGTWRSGVSITSGAWMFECKCARAQSLLLKAEKQINAILRSKSAKLPFANSSSHMKHTNMTKSEQELLVNAFEDSRQCRSYRGNVLFSYREYTLCISDKHC